MLAVFSPDRDTFFTTERIPYTSYMILSYTRLGSVIMEDISCCITQLQHSALRGAAVLRVQSWFSDNQRGGQAHCSARALQSSLTLQPPIRCVFLPKPSQTPAPGSEHSSQVPNSAGQNQVSVPVTAAAAQRAQTTQLS